MGMVSVSGTGNVQVNQALAVGLYTSSESVLVAPDGACVWGGRDKTQCGVLSLGQDWPGP